MSSILSDKFATALVKKMLSCGLSPKQTKSYIAFYLEQFQQDGQGNLPSVLTR